MQLTRRTIKKFVLVAYIMLGFALTLAMPQAALANHCNPDTEQEISIAIQDPNTGAEIHCVPKNAPDLQSNPIVGLLRTILQFMIGGIGIVLVGGLTVGGTVYMTARGNSQQVQKAETIIRNVIIGIALYVFAFAIINFIIPGGILRVD